MNKKVTKNLQLGKNYNKYKTTKTTKKTQRIANVPLIVCDYILKCSMSKMTDDPSQLSKNKRILNSLINETKSLKMYIIYKFQLTLTLLSEEK